MITLNKLTLSLAVVSLASGCGYVKRVQNCVGGSNCAIMGSTNASPIPGKPLEFTTSDAGDLSVSWGEGSDDTTARADLQYQLVVSKKADDIDSLTKVKISAKLNEAEPFAAANTAKTLRGLEDGKTYYFSVLIRDKDGNFAFYPPKPYTKPDVTAPLLSKRLYSTSVGADSITLKWGEVTDNVTPVANLEYKFVTSTNLEEISTIASANALTGSKIARDWSPNLSSAQMTGLTSSTLYGYSMMVRDAAGNIALRGPVLVQTLDISAPHVGAITFGSVMGTSLTLNWTAATDDITAQSNLIYKVAYSTELSDVDTIDKCSNAAPAHLISDWGGGELTRNVASLTSSKRYYFSVLVSDEAGNIAMYGPTDVNTLDVTAPTLGGGSIAFGEVGVDYVTAKWPAASDDLSSQKRLQYRVVTAPTLGAIDTLAEALAMTGDNVAQDWADDQRSIYIKGLASFTEIAVAVIVRDEAGNVALYPPVLTRTLDNNAPTAPEAFIGESNALMGSLTWYPSQDKETPTELLEYKVVTDVNPSLIDSVDRANQISGVGILQNWKTKIDWVSVPSNGLTETNVAILVRDPSGNTAISAVNRIYFPDTIPPVIGGAITSSLIGTNSASKTILATWPASTDNVTKPDRLLYTVVAAAQSTTIDTIEKTLANLYPDRDLCRAYWIGSNYGEPGLSITVDALNNVSTCYVSVVVWDLAGNRSFYPPTLIYNAPPALPPVFDVGLYSKQVTTTSALLAWGSAYTYDSSVPQYRVVRASTAAAIDTIAEIDAISGPALVMNYTPSVRTTTATGLTQNTTYYFAAVVRDGSGRKTLYPPIKVVTADPPSVGAAMVLAGGDLGSTIFTRKLQFTWTAATDNQTAGANLEYRIVRAYSTSDISTAAAIASCAAPCRIVKDWTRGITAADLYVPANSRHNFALVVRNASGATTSYPLGNPITVGGFQPTLSGTGKYSFISRVPNVSRVAAYESNDGGAFSQIGAGFGDAAVVDWDGSSLLRDSAGTLWATVTHRPCNAPFNWVGATRVYKYDGTAWAQLTGDLAGTTVHCTDPSGASRSGTFYPSIFELGDQLAVAQQESYGTWKQVYRYSPLVSPGPVAGWSNNQTTENVATSFSSTLTAGNSAYVFADAGLTPVVRKVTTSGFPAVLTTSNLAFPTSVPNGTWTAEANAAALPRLAIDTAANKLYAVYIDPNNAWKASASVYNLASPGWSNSGLVAFTPGEAENVSILYANNLIYVLFKDHSRGGDATLMSWNGATWSTVGFNLFGGEVMNPLMKWNVVTSKMDIYAVLPANTSKTFKVSL